MSHQTLKEITKKMVADEKFRTELLTDAESTLTRNGYSISAEELEALKGLRAEDLLGLSQAEFEAKLAECVVIDVTSVKVSAEMA